MFIICACASSCKELVLVNHFNYGIKLKYILNFVKDKIVASLECCILIMVSKCNL